ncbi:MAG: hypothetical protein L6R48_25585 [Planctomycetes bacterium]|nr:hypothetical protein [Planctomycetota bacterium]
MSIEQPVGMALDNHQPPTVDGAFMVHRRAASGSGDASRCAPTINRLPPTPAAGVSRLLACALLALAGALAAADPVAAARAIADGAARSWYTHRLEVDEAARSYGLDCSGFVSLALERSAPAALAAVPRVAGRTRRLAADFHAAFAAAPADAEAGWRRVLRVDAARAGDLVAWSHPDHAPGEDTGHVVFLDQDPLAEDGGRFRVRVLDCTSTPHADDRRVKGEGGVGRGTMRLVAGEDGGPAALVWGDPRRPARPWPIAIARWRPPAAP